MKNWLLHHLQLLTVLRAFLLPIIKVKLSTLIKNSWSKSMPRRKYLGYTSMTYIQKSWALKDSLRFGMKYIEEKNGTEKFPTFKKAEKPFGNS